MDSDKKKQSRKPAPLPPLNLSGVSNALDKSSATDSLPPNYHTHHAPAKSAPTTPRGPNLLSLRPLAPARTESVLNRNDDLPKSKSTSHLLNSNRTRRTRKPKRHVDNDGFTVESICHFGEAILNACQEEGNWVMTENTFASIPATPFEPEYTYEGPHKAFYAETAREREENEKKWASQAASRAASDAASRRASGQRSPSLQSRSQSWVSSRSAPRTPFEKRAEARVALKFDDYFGVTQLGPNGEEDERLNSPDFIEKVGEQLEIMEAEKAAEKAKEEEESPEEILTRMNRDDPLLKLGRRIGKVFGYGPDPSEEGEEDQEEEEEEEDEEDEEMDSEAELARVCEEQRRESRRAARRRAQGSIIAPIPPEQLRVPAEHGGGWGDFVWFTTLAWRAIL